MTSKRRQRGWVGLIVILIALAIVAFLAKDALKAYGLLGGAATPADPARQGERTRLPAAATDGNVASPATPSFQAPIERARSVESTVLQQADQQRRALDEQGK
jgi:hypothetical protein